jgi:hypothetical protein
MTTAYNSDFHDMWHKDVCKLAKAEFYLKQLIEVVELNLDIESIENLYDQNHAEIVLKFAKNYFEENKTK